ncbi:MAG TPA: hypothetical protein VMG12_30740 [Polyangiaceae bacterium]|nr:hypothetical protein [Polyangiaceae bacterium]
MGAGLLFLACHKPEPAKEPAPERDAYLAQPCPELALADAPLDADKARVFVEVAEVSTKNLPQPIGRWLDENSVRVRSTANLVAFPNVPTSMPWGQCVDAVCSSMKLSITLTAQLPERTSQPVALALRIDEAAAEGSEAPPRALLETTLAATHQEPVVLPPSPEVSDGSVIVTAYLLQKHDDLQRIMACQARRTPGEAGGAPK